jgi:tRNA-uridine 2-sulfurtransferase
MQKQNKVIIGLSGGVDSAVAAKLLLDQGWQLEALFMKNWDEDDSDEYCSAATDLEDAQAVADMLGIKLHKVNFSTEYWDRVFEYFLAEYRAGRTPNPDVLCNREIKFKAFLDYALNLGADYIATGHYARRQESTNGSVELCLCQDAAKDQTYFLYMLNQHQLSHALFPLSELPKDEVRRIAAEANFPNHAKKDSTGICFIGERKFSDFLSRFLPANPGPMRTAEGEEIGQHKGLMYYTLGQRKGLGIGGRSDTDEIPWFVVDKDLDNNVLLVAQGHDHPLLLKQNLDASQLHWVSERPPNDLPLDCHARIRHRQPLQQCQITTIQDDSCQVHFNQQQRAVAPGQSIVFYSGDICLGGGIIERAY